MMVVKQAMPKFALPCNDEHKETHDDEVTIDDDASSSTFTVSTTSTNTTTSLKSSALSLSEQQDKRSNYSAIRISEAKNVTYEKSCEYNLDEIKAMWFTDDELDVLLKKCSKEADDYYEQRSATERNSFKNTETKRMNVNHSQQDEEQQRGRLIEDRGDEEREEERQLDSNDEKYEYDALFHCPLGLEAWTQQGYKRRQLRRRNALHSVLNEQFGSWNRLEPERPEIISAVYGEAVASSKRFATLKGSRLEQEVKQDLLESMQSDYDNTLQILSVLQRSLNLIKREKNCKNEEPSIVSMIDAAISTVSMQSSMMGTQMDTNLHYGDDSDKGNLYRFKPDASQSLRAPITHNFTHKDNADANTNTKNEDTISGGVRSNFGKKVVQSGNQANSKDNASRKPLSPNGESPLPKIRSKKKKNPKTVKQIPSDWSSPLSSSKSAPSPLISTSRKNKIKSSQKTPNQTKDKIVGTSIKKTQDSVSCQRPSPDKKSLSPSPKIRSEKEKKQKKKKKKKNQNSSLSPSLSNSIPSPGISTSKQRKHKLTQRITNQEEGQVIGTPIREKQKIIGLPPAPPFSSPMPSAVQRKVAVLDSFPQHLPLTPTMSKKRKGAKPLSGRRKPETLQYINPQGHNVRKAANFLEERKLRNSDKKYPLNSPTPRTPTMKQVRQCKRFKDNNDRMNIGSNNNVSYSNNNDMFLGKMSPKSPKFDLIRDGLLSPRSLGRKLNSSLLSPRSVTKVTPININNKPARVSKRTTTAASTKMCRTRNQK